MGSRVEKTKKNIVASVIQNIINILIALVSRVIFVHILDSSYLGINGLFTNILNILSLADLGMTTAMMYHLYKPLAENDEEAITALVTFFKKIYIGIAGVIFILGICLIPFLGYIINLPEDVPYIKIYYILALLNVVISYLYVYRTTLISADQKNYIINNCIIIFKIITFVFQTLVLVLFKNYILYLLVAVVTNYLCNVCQNKIALKLYPYLKRTSVLELKEKKNIYEDVKSLFMYKICGTIQSNTDSILISIFSGTILVGYYSNYVLIITQIVNVVTLIFNSVKASVGNMIFSHDSKNEYDYFIFEVLELINFWIICFCTVSFFCLSKEFVEICFGQEYVLSYAIVIAICLNFYSSNIRQVIWVFRETTGIFTETKYITAVTAILNIILSIILGYKLGMFGIIIATVLARYLYAWWKEPMILYSIFFKKSSKLYFEKYVSRILITVIITGLTWLITEIISIDNILISLIINMMVCIIVPNIIIFLLYYKTDEFQYIKQKVIVPMLHKIKNS